MRFFTLNHRPSKSFWENWRSITSMASALKVFHEGGVRMLEWIKGGLFGVAIGDALGATTEFMNVDEVRRKYGKVTDIIGGGYHGLKPGGRDGRYGDDDRGGERDHSPSGMPDC